MIELYGKPYAKNNSDAVNTLFDPVNGRTANGFYKKTVNGFQLYDLQGKARVFVRDDGLGPVTIHKTKRGVRYMYGLCSLDAEWLGVEQ